MEAAGMALGLVSSICSIISTAADIARISRDTITIRTAYENLKDGVEGNGAGTLTGNTMRSQCDRLLQVCNELSSTIAACDGGRDDSVLTRRLGRMSRDRGFVWDGTGHLGEAGDWQVACQHSFNVAEPILWKLEDWITHQTERMLGIVHMRLPEITKKPPSHIVLLSWAVLAFSLAAVQRESTEQNRKGAILLCSVLGAVGLGFVEGSSSTSIILTNIPWCITFGMLGDAAASFASWRLERRTSYSGQYTSDQVGEKLMENAS